MKAFLDKIDTVLDATITTLMMRNIFFSPLIIMIWMKETPYLN